MCGPSENPIEQFSDIAKSGDIDAMIDAEIAAILRERKACRNSDLSAKFWAASDNLSKLKWMLETVRDPVEYRVIVDGDPVRRWDDEGLPLDHFRRILAVHIDRLIDLGLMKGIPPVRAAFLEARRKNMEACEPLYKSMQRRALGGTTEGDDDKSHNYRQA